MGEKMTKCGFCKIELPQNQAFEVCDRCGIQIWGEKMFNAIKQNMESAKEEGNLFQGSVGNQFDKDTYRKTAY